MVGPVPNTKDPVPVSSVIAAARFALDGVARKAAMFAANPLTPDEIGKPEQFVRVPEDGVPIAGVVSVGDVAKTSAPLPVSPVTADARFADDGVARKVAIPAASPEIPVATGSPVQLVNVPDEGVPMAGVTRVGELANTRDPVPVSSVTAASKFALLGVFRNA